MSVLFVGNGINRYAGIVPGWSELFAKAVNIDGFEVKHSLTPTLEYELNIRNAFAKNNQKTAEVIKKDIAAYLMQKQTDAVTGWEQKIHIPLLRNAPQIILTTNYDYFLELAADPDFKVGPASTKEWLYSKERYRDVPGHRIYHIHGEASVPSSICLGFEHYVGSIQFIRAELTRSTAEKGTKSLDNALPKKRYHIYDVLSGLDSPVKDRWYYYFFTEDIYILGFGLDAAEQDIWWLLNNRAGLKHTHPELIKNTITYLETDSEHDAAPEDSLLLNTIKICGDRLPDDKKEAALRKYADKLSAYNAKKQLLAQKKAQLEAFGVTVKDCTDAADIISSTSGGAVDWSQVYALRYQRALSEIKDGSKK